MLKMRQTQSQHHQGFVDDDTEESDQLCVSTEQIDAEKRRKENKIKKKIHQSHVVARNDTVNIATPHTAHSNTLLFLLKRK